MSAHLPYDLTRITRWSIPLTWTLIGLNLAFVSEYLFYQQIYGEPKPFVLLGEQAPVPSTLRLVIGGLALALSLAAYVLNGMWIYRASANARSIQPYPSRISPGWSVGWYFIPVANLWKPFAAMRQIWDTFLPRSGLLGWWWALWLVSGVLSMASGALVNQIGASNTFVLGAYIVLQLVTSVLCMYAFIQIVRRVTAAQSNHSPAAIFA